LVTRRLASRVVVSVGLTLDRDVIAVEGEVGGLAEPVRARRLTDQEGRKLQQIVRRGRHESVRVRRALIIMASASGTTVPAIARLVAAHEDTVRDVIHAFNERGLAALDPQWAGGRPRLISSDDEEFIVTAATTRPVKLGRPFTHWSIRKLADYLADNPVRVVKVGRERLRQILRQPSVDLLPAGRFGLVSLGTQARQDRRKVLLADGAQVPLKIGRIGEVRPRGAKQGGRLQCARPGLLQQQKNRRSKYQYSE
jgi:transposase